MAPEDYALLREVVKSYVWLTNVVRHSKTTLHQLRRLLGWSSSEKTGAVLAQAGAGKARPADEPPDPDGGGGASPTPPAGSGEGPAWSGQTTTPPVSEAKKKAKGHGRRAASEYAVARHIEVTHESLCPGDRCPLCGRGTLYELEEPAQFLRLFGQPPLSAVCWDCQRLRCSACGAVHTARAPAQAQGGKYAESAVSMLAVLRFGTGVPHHRLGGLQDNLETPVPASTQWEVLEAAAEDVQLVHEELIRQAAQGTVLHNDDTRGPVLGLMGKRREALLARGKLEDPERTGLFTTAVVALTTPGQKIALFFTGRKHAGENLSEVLGQRAEGLDPPIQMSDALSANHPAGKTVMSSHCLAHARRNFVDEIANFPEECRYLLERIGTVFAVDQECRQQGLSDQERLLEHQLRSGPVMDELCKWMNAQFDDKRVEPNSGLGKAFQYLLKRWDRFTLFLRLAGVPLDNNICERALKMAIRHRKNSLFYRTEHGAEIGDLYMSLIHTAQLCGENAFEYLTALLTHAREVAQAPAKWMPWTWREAASRLGTRQDSQAA